MASRRILFGYKATLSVRQHESKAIRPLYTEQRFSHLRVIHNQQITNNK